MDGISYNKKSILERLDTIPTENSTNSVTSGGVKSYVDGIAGELSGEIENISHQLVDPFTFKGVVANTSSFPANPSLNDTYYVTSAHCLYTYNGSSWAQSSMSETDYLQALATLRNNIAPDYSNASTYSVGQYCVYNNALYVCKTPITSAESWTPGHWEAVNFASSIDDIVLVQNAQPTTPSNKIWIPETISEGNRIPEISDLENIIAQEYSVSSTYSIGDYCIREVSDEIKLYRCIVAITVSESWDSDHWEEIDLSSAVENIVLVQDSQPTASVNKIWMKETTPDPIEIPKMSDIENIVSDEYDATRAYSIGDYCMRTDSDNTKLYKCNTSIPSGGESWNSLHWTEVQIVPELTSAFNNFATEFDASSSYEEGDIVVYNGLIYRFTSDHTGDWTGSDVVLTSMEDELKRYLPLDGYSAEAAVGHADTAGHADTSDYADKADYADNAEQLAPTTPIEDQAPYLFRSSAGSADIGNREYDTLVGGCVAWNQLAPSDYSKEGTGGVAFASGTRIIEGHKYYITFSRNQVSSYALTISVYVKVDGANKISFNLVFSSTSDVTRLHKETIAVAAYSGTSTGSYSASEGNAWIYQNDSGGEQTANGLQIIDLTQIFGTTIADYLYSLESATPGAGIAWFRSLFPKPYYAYNSGALLSVNASSHKMVGFNAYNFSTGTAKLLGGKQYQITGAYTALSYVDDNEDSETVTPDENGIFTPINNGTLTVIDGDSTNTCVHLVWTGYRNGEYEPYVEHTYPLDSDLTLRGIPKLDADGKLYYDGDIYEADGTVTRRYGIVDLGTLTWSINANYTNPFFTASLPSDAAAPVLGGHDAVCHKYVRFVTTATDWYRRIPDKTFISSVTGITSASKVYIRDDSYTDAATFKTAMSGVYLVYELATPTTESAEPFTNPQVVNDFGTEEYIITEQSGVKIPVGHTTKYNRNLRDKLQHLPSLADSDGRYAILQEGFDMSLINLPETAFNIPATPSTNGTYALKVIVSSGSATYRWVEVQ